MNEEPAECFLRILSGPHLGVCVPLPRGDFSIGSHDSDFVISDEAISPRHATLKVTSGNVELNVDNGGESTFLDGKPVTGEKFALVPEQVFTLGKTHFALTEKGDADGPRIELPTIELPEEENVEKEAAGDDKAILEPEDSSDENPISEAVSASDFARDESPRKSRGGCVFTMLLLLALLAAGIYFGGPFLKSLFAPAAPIEDPGPKIEPEQAFAELLKKYPEETGIEVEKNESNGFFTVNGLVSTSEVKSNLMREIREIAPTARVKLSTVSTVASSIQTTLNQLGAKSLASDFSPDGTLTLAGQMTDTTEIPKLTDRLTRDFSAIKKIDTDGIWTRDNLVDKLTAATADAGLEDFLSFALEGTKLLVGGTLPPNKSEPFEKLKADLKAEFEPTLTLVDEVKILKTIPASVRTVTDDPNVPPGDPGPNPDPGPSEVPLQEKAGIAGFQNVTVGPISWVVTSDGQKLLEGATLPSGFVVEKITRDYVQLRKNQIIETIYLK